MLVRTRLGALSAVVAAALLSACFPPFDAFLPFPFGGPGAFPGADGSLVVVNQTQDDWVLSVDTEFGPMAFAVPGGATGEAMLFGGAIAAVRLLDPECSEVDRLEWDPAFGAVSIDPPASLNGLDGADAAGETTLVEFWECTLGGGTPPTAGDQLDGASGSILLVGQDAGSWVLDLASGDLGPLGGGSPMDSEHSVSPDGTLVAFTRYPDDGITAQVLLARIDGTDERVLAENGFGPVFSPDGSQVAFVDLDPFAGGGMLTVVDLAGDEQARIAPNASAPRWSPDGTRIAFTTADPGTFMGGDSTEPSELQVIDADGSDLRTLADAANFSAPPAWSPDGTSIAFTGPERGGSLDGATAIALVEVAGGDIRTLAEVDGASLSEPVWSPDGEQVAFTMLSFGFFSTGGNVGTVRVDGGDVVEFDATADAFYGSPVWSPDGRWIAVTRTATNDFAADLVAIDIGSGEETVIASDLLYAAAWLPIQLRN